MKTIRFFFPVLILVAMGSAQTLQSSHEPTKLAAVASAQSVKAGPPVARVNGVEISREEFEKEKQRIFPYYSMHGGTVPDEYKEDVRKKALSRLIDDELMYQEAKRRKIVITPAEYQKRLSGIRKDFGGTPQQFDAAMIKYFGSRQKFEAKLRHDMLLDKILNTEVKNKSAISEVELQKYYQQNKAMFVVPESVSFQSISALYPKNATSADKSATRKRIDAVAQKAFDAKNFEQFGLLAEKSSEDEYGVMMGFHKMAHKAALDPSFGVLFTMKDGEITKVIESAGGFHILRLDKHNLRRQLTLAEVRNDLKASLQKDKQKAVLGKFTESLRKTAKVEML